MFAIARIIGTGMEDDAYRADVSGSDWSAIIPSNPDGTPRFNWCLVKLNNPDMATGTQLFKLPDIKLDTQVRDIPASIQNAVNTKLQSLGVDTSWITLDTTLREVVKKIGKHLDINFATLGERF